MPKIGQAVCINEQAHRDGVNKLLKEIAKAHDKARGDVVIAYHEDISVYAVRMWLNRPIPKRHWAVLAKLSGYSIEKIENIATKHFDMNAVS